MELPEFLKKFFSFFELIFWPKYDLRPGFVFYSARGTICAIYRSQSPKKAPATIKNKIFSENRIFHLFSYFWWFTGEGKLIWTLLILLFYTFRGLFGCSKIIQNDWNFAWTFPDTERVSPQTFSHFWWIENGQLQGGTR